MRKSFLFLLVLILPLFTYADDHGRDLLTGYWLNPKLDVSIKVKQRADVLLVKGLMGNRETEIFEQVCKDKFVDHRGNTLIIENHNTLVFEKRNGRKYLRFRKINDDDRNYGHGKNRGNRWDEDDHFFDNDNNYPQKGDRQNDRDRYDDESSRNNRQNNGWDNNNYASRVSGTWTDREHTVAIVDTRDGLKAKFSGSDKWVDYTMDRSGYGTFVDKKGNRYVFKNDNEVIWTSADRNKKDIVLRRLSNEVKY